MCQSSSTVWAVYPDGRKEKIADAALYVWQDGPMVSVAGFEDGPARFIGDIAEVDVMSLKITLRVEKRAEVEPAGDSLVYAG